MSASAYSRAHDLFPDDALLPLGERKVQDIGKSPTAYVAYPQPHARNNGLTQSTKVDLYIDGITGALLVLPPNVDLEDVVGPKK